MTRILRTPFFVVNPKAYLYGKDSLALAKEANSLAKEHDLDILFTAQHVDLAMISDNCENLIVTSQHMDGFSPGRGMGHILPDALVSAGVEATFLNHAEHPMYLGDLIESIDYARKKGLLSIVCANSFAEVESIATLLPDVMVCEPNELIGTGETSDDAYMIETRKIIKRVSPKTLVLQAAGISTVEDVKKAFDLGAEGTGGTSGIVCSENPVTTLRQLVEKTATYKKGL